MPALEENHCRDRRGRLELKQLLRFEVNFFAMCQRVDAQAKRAAARCSYPGSRSSSRESAA